MIAVVLVVTKDPVSVAGATALCQSLPEDAALEFALRCGHCSDQAGLGTSEMALRSLCWLGR